MLRGAAQTITPDKTKLLLLKTLLMLKRVPENFHETALGKEISLSPSASDLGVIMDSLFYDHFFLSYDDNVSQVVWKRTSSFCEINDV